MEQDKTPRHILLATTGESPQVVTETLYAIHEEGLTWPDEIRLITTTVGKARARKGLLDEGHLARLCDEIGKPLPLFDETHIEVVPGADGTEVDDARSLEDHEALGDFIMTRVRDLTVTDEQGKPVQTVHASLAGGRKTMTFYLGYAMSLFGRREDTLSHVLISRGFEGNPGFWFPTAAPEHRYLQDRQGEKMDASKATVTLASIPFIRHRQELPAHLRKKPQDEADFKFNQLVQLINLGEQPENISIHIDLINAKIVISERIGSIKIEINPSKLDLAFYSMMARATLENQSDLTRPQKNKPSKGLTRVYLDELLPICGLTPSDSTGQDLDNLENWNKSDSDKIGFVSPFKNSTFSSLRSGIKDTWFDQRRNSLQTIFEEKLPRSVCKHILPEIIWTEDGKLLREKPTPEQERERRALEREAAKENKSTKTRRRAAPKQEESTEKFRKHGGGYGIPLPAHSIQLLEA